MNNDEGKTPLSGLWEKIQTIQNEPHVCVCVCARSHTHMVSVTPVLARKAGL